MGWLWMVEGLRVTKPLPQKTPESEEACRAAVDRCLSNLVPQLNVGT